MTFSLDPFCHGNPISFFLFLFLAIIVLAIKIYDIRMKSRFFEAGWFQFSQCRRFVKIVGKNYRHYSVWLVKWTVRFQVRITGKFQKKNRVFEKSGFYMQSNFPNTDKATDPGGGGLLNIFLYGEAPPRGPTRYPFIYYFSRKRYSFSIPSIDKWYPFHIPRLELCIPLSFNCWKCIVI